MPKISTSLDVRAEIAVMQLLLLALIGQVPNKAAIVSELDHFKAAVRSMRLPASERRRLLRPVEELVLLMHPARGARKKRPRLERI